MNKTFQNFFRGAFVTLAAVFLAGCGSSTPDSYKINLEVWGTFDDTDAFQQVFSAYQEINPHIGQITYRKLPVESYKQDIIDALASGNGPDIFLVRNSWMGDFQDKMLPAPTGMIGEKLYHDTFPDVAATDFIREEGAIYAVPLSIDSLALYYNKDIFNANGVARPPATWEEVEQLVPRLTQVDALGNITQSAIAMGTSQKRS
jgi:multiple sugar transport system substrate-binding protein